MSIPSLVQSIKASHDSTPLTDAQITDFSTKAGFQFPPSYRAFLKELATVTLRLRAFTRSSLKISMPQTILGHFKGHTRTRRTPCLLMEPHPFQRLYCLMTEDSNGGAWCWMTSAGDEDGEVPLAYYDPSRKKLSYPVPSFSAWLEILVRGKQEVIRSLDLEEKLGLG